MESLSRTKRFQAVRASLRVARLLAGVAALALVLAVPAMAQSEEFDSYKIRIDGFWAYSNPSGSVQGSADNGTVDLQKDLGFNSYSTRCRQDRLEVYPQEPFVFCCQPVRHIPSDGFDSNHRFPGANVHRWLNDPQQPPVESLCSRLSVRHYPAKARAFRTRRAD